MKKGSKHKPESLVKLSQSMRLVPSWNDGSAKALKRLEQCQSMGKNNKGKIQNPETNIQRSLSQIGEKHWNWKGGGKETENDKLRHRKAYKNWRKLVIERDGECQICGSLTNLQADHIKGFAFYPELRYKLSNGRAICYECHKKTESWGRKVEVIAQHSISC